MTFLFTAGNIGHFLNTQRDTDKQKFTNTFSDFIQIKKNYNVLTTSIKIQPYSTRHGALLYHTKVCSSLQDKSNMDLSP